MFHFDSRTVKKFTLSQNWNWLAPGLKSGRMARQRGIFDRTWLWVLLAIVLVGGGFMLFDHWRARHEASHDAVILAAGARYGVDPALVKAVVWRESWFDPQARGKAGEIGLMQVGELAAQEWAETERVPFFTHSQLFDPGRNTQAGAWYLAKLLRRYNTTDNPVPYALADYNAGRANVLKWLEGAAKTNSATFIEQIGFPSTQKYVRSVMERYDFYRATFPPKSPSQSAG